MPPKDPAKVYPFEAFGVKASMPRWALGPLALVVIAIGGIYAYRQLQSPVELVSLKDANKQLAAEIEEYGLHAMEEPEAHELFPDPDQKGKLLIRIFKDHCVLIQRQTIRGFRSKLVMDLARQVVMVQQARPLPTFDVFPVAFAQAACNRGCLNPHPGQFTSWYGQRLAGGWVEVWRKWPEGCQHVQLFQPQTGAWDTNPDGSPRVKWTCCVH